MPVSIRDVEISLLSEVCVWVLRMQAQAVLVGGRYRDGAAGCSFALLSGREATSPLECFSTLYPLYVVWVGGCLSGARGRSRAGSRRR